MIVVNKRIRTTGLIAAMDMEVQGQPYTDLAKIAIDTINDLASYQQRHLKYAPAKKAGLQEIENPAFIIIKKSKDKKSKDTEVNVPAGTYRARNLLVFFESGYMLGSGE